jgi:hypothetical protein
MEKKNCFCFIVVIDCDVEAILELRVLLPDLVHALLPLRQCQLGGQFSTVSSLAVVAAVLNHFL